VQKPNGSRKRLQFPSLCETAELLLILQSDWNIQHFITTTIFTMLKNHQYHSFISPLLHMDPTNDMFWEERSTVRVGWLQQWGVESRVSQYSFLTNETAVPEREWRGYGEREGEKKYASACTRCTLYTHVWVMFLRDGHFNISSDYSLNNKGCKRKWRKKT